MLLHHHFKNLVTPTGIDKTIHIAVVLFKRFLYTRILKIDIIYSMGKKIFKHIKNARALRAHQPLL